MTKTRFWLFFSLIQLFFLIINIAMAPYHPVPWQDEVGYSDPAVNLASGNGFKSSLWYAQGPDEFWAGNVPAYQILLSGWLKIFGFNIIQVRSLNYVLIAMVILLLVLIFKTDEKKQHLYNLLVFSILIWASYGISFSYRSGRPDTLAILLTVLIFGLFVWKLNPGLKLIILFICGAFIPWTGLQLIPFLALPAILVLIGLPDHRLKVISLGVGGLVGSILLYLFYQHREVWEAFLNSVLPHAVGGNYSNADVFEKITIGYQEAFKNPTVFLLALFVSGSAALQFTQKRMVDLPLKGALFFLFLTPFWMSLSGKFAIYYSWMIELPVMIILFDWMTKTTFWNHKKSIILGVLTVLILSGLPLRFGIAIMDLQKREMASLQIDLPPFLSSSDSVFAVDRAYYGLKNKVSYIGNFVHLNHMSETELNGINKVILFQGMTIPDALTARHSFTKLATLNDINIPENQGHYYALDIYQRLPQNDFNH